MRDDEKYLFSHREMMLVAAVAALIIGVGVISAFPAGLHLSPSYEVSYAGTDTTLLTGDIDVDGGITGTMAVHNITSWRIAAVGPVNLTVLGGDTETFDSPTVSIKRGDGGMLNGTMSIAAPLSPGAAVFNGSRNGTWAFTAPHIPLEIAAQTTLTMTRATIAVDGEPVADNESVSLVMGGNASGAVAADYCVVSSRDTVALTVEQSGSFNRTLLDMLGEELPPLPVSLDGAAAVLPDNGTTLMVDGGERRCDTVSLLRGTWNASFSHKASLRGTAQLVFLDGSLYSPADATVWFIPDKLLGLWPLALGIWLVTSFLRRRYLQNREPYDRNVHWLAILVHLLVLAVTFFLWDAEVRYLFGTSLLDTAAAAVSTGSTSLAAWTVAPLELVPWFIGLALIALPVRVILSAVFRLVGFDILGGGIAKAAGLLSLLFIGALYIPFFLNVTVLALLRSMLGV